MNGGKMVQVYRCAAFGCRLVRLMCSCFAGWILLAAPQVSYAEGTVNPAYSTSAPPMVKYYGYTGVNFDAPSAACADTIAHSWEFTSQTGGVYDHVEPYTDNVMKCFATFYVNSNPVTSWYSNVLIMRSCDGLGWNNYQMTCAKNVCPDNSTATPEDNPANCTCDKDYVPDATKTRCVPATTCPVGSLSQPPFSDDCSTSLERGNGVDIDHKCDPLSDSMKKAASCIAAKINALSSPKLNYSTPSATVRTAEYQNHLREIWNKSKQLDSIMNGGAYTDEVKHACVQRKAEIDAHKMHGLKSQPSSAGDAAPHVEHRAIDIPKKIIDSMTAQVNVYVYKMVKVNGKNILKKVLISDVEDYVHSATINPPACDSMISWGGRFDPVDPVHFQLPK